MAAEESNSEQPLPMSRGPAPSVRELLRIAVGLILLIAAALKGHGLMQGSLAEDSFVASPHLQIVAIEVELLLGLWLLSGRRLRAAWAAAVGFFAIMACVSLYLALDGQQSCGCAGSAVTISPWLTFTLDTVVTAALLVWRPARSTGARPSAWLRGVLKTGFGAVAIVVFVFLMTGPPHVLGQDNDEALRRRFLQEAPTQWEEFTRLSGELQGTLSTSHTGSRTNYQYDYRAEYKANGKGKVLITATKYISP